MIVPIAIAAPPRVGATMTRSVGTASPSPTPGGGRASRHGSSRHEGRGEGATDRLLNQAVPARSRRRTHSGFTSAMPVRGHAHNGRRVCAFARGARWALARTEALEDALRRHGVLRRLGGVSFRALRSSGRRRGALGPRAGSARQRPPARRDPRGGVLRGALRLRLLEALRLLARLLLRGGSGLT